MRGLGTQKNNFAPNPVFFQFQTPTLSPTQRTRAAKNRRRRKVFLRNRFPGTRPKKSGPEFSRRRNTSPVSRSRCRWRHQRRSIPSSCWWRHRRSPSRWPILIPRTCSAPPPTFDPETKLGKRFECWDLRFLSFDGKLSKPLNSTLTRLAKFSEPECCRISFIMKKW